MSALPLTVISLVVGLIAVGALATLVTWKKVKGISQSEPDNRVFFILGVCFLPMAIIFTVTIGVAFIWMIGLGAILHRTSVSQYEEMEQVRL